MSPHRNGTKRTGRTLLRATLAAPLTLVLCLVVPADLTGQAVRSLSFAMENDGFAFWTPPGQRSDWYYTHGMEIEGVFAWAFPGSSILGGEEAPPCGTHESDSPCSLTRFSLGQSIFTPEALFTPSPPTGDRPYAGWLYLETSAIRMENQSVRRLGLDIGVTGGPSMAGPLHRWVHRALGKHEPMGWHTQIPFELAFTVTYESRKSIDLAGSSEGTSLRLEPIGILQGGTLRTGATGGATLQLGFDAVPFLEWVGTGSSETSVLTSFGVAGELVLRDLFLDGSTFGGGPHVERIPLVGHFQSKLLLQTKAIGFEFSASRRTSQFKGQGGHHYTGAVRFIIRP